METVVAIDAVLIALGAVFVLGLVADTVGRLTPVPRVSVLILAGLVVGEGGLGLMPASVIAVYELLAAAAIALVAFTLGGALDRSRLRRHGRAMLLVSLSVSLVTLLAVAAGLLALGVAAPLAVALACIATATDPAAVVDVLRQRRAGGGFTERLLAVTAVDDAWGLILFGIALAGLAATGAADAAGGGPLLHALGDLGGATLVGLAIGLPAAALTGRIRHGEPLLVEVLGTVFLCAGIARALDVSYLLACMVAGAVVANLARHHVRPFHMVERVEWPMLVLFFVLAGASTDLPALRDVLWLVALYAALRVAGRLAGGWIGARLAGLPPAERRWTGLALLPQAGVAVGMALVAGEHFPDLQETLVAVTIATTVLFEVAGPVLTGLAVARVAAADAPTARHGQS